MAGQRTAGFVVALVVACALGCIVGALDLQVSEVQSTVLVILVFTFVMGAASPRFAWLWALVIGGGVFAASAITQQGPSNHLYETLLALLPAFLGAYLGVGARALLSAGASRM